MSSIYTVRSGNQVKEPTIYDSPTFGQDFRIHVNEAVGSASISPNGRDVVLASQQGLHIIDLDSPFSPPRHLKHQTPWTPADVQWSPFASRYSWVVSTSNQRALVWNLELSTRQAPIEHTLHAHSRAITDINFSVFHPDMLATCAVDAFVHCWDLRIPARPVVSFSDWFAGATQVKWNRQNEHIIASSHDKNLHVWDDRKGALPLKTIEAHETKIYGIDWNRSKESKIITCSLDCTIKHWDYETSEEEPERTIDTPYPVWRARHTPFGSGVLAMPQRGNNDLHMYDIRVDHAIVKENSLEVLPNYSFTGHREQAKEFLWRARGTIDNHTDDRDFQLVTWGADRELILHKMGPKQLMAVGSQKGMPFSEPWVLTRRGAPYKTFRDKPITPVVPLPDDRAGDNTGDLAYTGTSPGMNKAPIPIAGGWANGGSMMKYSGMETRNAKPQDKDLIGWMKGVKFGKRGTAGSERRKSRKLSAMTTMDLDELPETLSDEIIHVGDRFRKVKFQEADVSARKVRVALNGPWSSDGKLAYLQLYVDFPQDYPEATTPHFQLEHTSSLTESKFLEIENGLRTIAMGYLVHRKGCLEAILSYLLGERDLQESTEWLTLGEETVDSTEQGDSSSDEEDALIGDPGPGESQTLDIGDSMGSGILSSNTNVPLPRSCSALWAPNGRLVCFFPPKEEQKSMLQRAAFSDTSRYRASREMIFEGFGRLHADSPDPTLKGRSIQEESDSDDDDRDSDDTSATSSSTSSSSSEGPDMVPTRFRPPAAWHGGSLRINRLKTNSNDGSVPTSNGLSKRPAFARNKTVIMLHDIDDLLPSKRCLAQEYLLFGDGPTLCAHNAHVAIKNQLLDTANVWALIKLILSNDVPLTILTSNGRESVAVLAQRAMVRIKRKDSGLDLSFDQPGGIVDPHEKALVKWGNHPFAATWLIQRLFDHFETSADIQMLAMLSCVFAQSAVELRANEGVSLDLPASMRLPAQSKEYFPTKEAAFGLDEPTISVSESPSQPARTPGTTYGSAESAFHDSDPLTPFSLKYTPPMPLSRGSTQLSSVNQSLSTSPEQHRVSVTSAHSSFAASMWARPFNLASSPPTRQRLSGEDLSASTPSNAGTPGNRNNRVFNRSDSTIRNSYMAQGLAEEYDAGSSTDEDDLSPPKIAIKLSLKNQEFFDDEATANVPFLTAERAVKYACYREAYAHMLGYWGLEMQRNEVLKYNGIVSTKTSERKDRDSHSTLTLGRLDAHHEPEIDLGPQIVRCCTKCSRVDANAVGGKLDTKCSKCKTKSQIMSCTVCMEPVVGLYKVCLACGHAAHSSCLQLLLESLPEDETECETGCGCVCEDHAVVDSEVVVVGSLEPPEEEAEMQEEEDEPEPQLQPQPYQRGLYSTLHGRRGTITTATEGRRLAAAERSRYEAVRPKTAQHGRRRSYVPGAYAH